MIPKKIHYCWFGGKPMPDEFRRYMDTWREFCPDYTIIRWDESNYNVNKNRYMWEAYQQKRWGFVPDFARLDIIYEHGGVYLDTDVELIKNIDPLLQYNAFAGMQLPGIVALGLGFGATAHHPTIKKMLSVYETLPFVNADGTLNLVASPDYQTATLKQLGLSDENVIQNIGDICVLPTEYLCPIDYRNNHMNLTDQAYAIHHFAATWLTAKQKRLRDLEFRLMKYDMPFALKRVITLPYKADVILESGGWRSLTGVVWKKLRVLQ